METDLRTRAVNDAPVRPERELVLYWMIAARRARSSFALDRAIGWAQELGKPLLVLEALRCDFPWASDRLHRFVLEGMADNRRAFAGSPVAYAAYVEPSRDAGKGLLRALGARASVVVTDELPCFFLPRAVEAAGRRVDARLEAVDSNGLLPLAAAERAFPTAYAFRRFLQRTLPEHLDARPSPAPLARLRLPRLERLPAELRERWPALDEAALDRPDAVIADLPVDHSVGAVDTAGGARAGERVLRAFVERRLGGYAEDRNDVAAPATSGLSPYLHFGHVAAHDVFARIVEHERWKPARLAEQASGKREGWWGMGPAAEAFLDQLVTWRELGHVFCARTAGYDRFETLPDWARETLGEHAPDRREHVYSRAELAAAGTHDELWNAAQRQLLREGGMHNYLRMLWGKKILEWSRTPEEAFETTIDLNNRYALDGRDPNSYSGIAWCFGRFDRPWGPERPIFGKVRYMSSANTRRKMKVDDYLEAYGPDRLF